MSLASKRLPEYTFTVQYARNEDLSPVKREVRAAYFVNEDGFHILKDGGHTPVYAVRNSIMVSIQRGAAV